MSNLNIEDIDVKGFYRDFLNFGNKLYNQYQSIKPLDVGLIEGNIVFSGMGGSGIIGDVLRDYIYYNENIKFDKFIVVNKSHIIPKCLNKDSLLIAISYSGNTVETINVVMEALKLGLEVICISSGGRLEELCKEKGLIHLRVNKAMAPRSALPELLAASMRVLEDIIELDFKNEIEEAAKYLGYLREYWGPIDGSEPLELAKEIKDKVPLIYVPIDLLSVGIRAKTAFNENSKIHAYFDVYPELFHNEVMAYDKSIQKIFTPIFIGGNSKVKKFYEYIINNGGHAISIEYPSDTGRLAAILKLIMLFDLASIYLAVMKGIDPYPVRLISLLKKEG